MVRSVIIFPLLCFILFSFVMVEQGDFSFYHENVDGINFSSDPPAERTGAPGENDCSQCHSGTVQSGFGIVDYSYSGTDQKYLPGQTYTITIGSATGNKNGFEMTILDNNLDAAGTFVPGANTSVISSNGRNYIRHNTSDSINSWSFEWEAPLNDMGDLTVYYSYNKSNNDGTSSGDPIYIGQQMIYSSFVADLSEHEQLDNEFQVVYRPDLREVELKYKVISSGNVFVIIHDGQGKEVMRKSVGLRTPELYNEIITVPVEYSSGVYIVNLFIGNQVLNRKIFID